MIKNKETFEKNIFQKDICIEKDKNGNFTFFCLYKYDLCCKGKIFINHYGNYKLDIQYKNSFYDKYYKDSDILELI